MICAGVVARTTAMSRAQPDRASGWGSTGTRTGVSTLTTRSRMIPGRAAAGDRGAGAGEQECCLLPAPGPGRGSVAAAASVGQVKTRVACRARTVAAGCARPARREAGAWGGRGRLGAVLGHARAETAAGRSRGPGTPAIDRDAVTGGRAGRETDRLRGAAASAQPRGAGGLAGLERRGGGAAGRRRGRGDDGLLHRRAQQLRAIHPDVRFEAELILQVDDDAAVLEPGQLGTGGIEARSRGDLVAFEVRDRCRLDRAGRTR